MRRARTNPRSGPGGPRLRPARYAVAIAAGLVGSAAVAPAREPLDLVPAETLLCWHGRPLPGSVPLSEQPSAIQTLVELGTRIAGRSLDPKARLGLRTLELLGLTVRYPHALALIDARARPLEPGSDSRRVDRLRLALIVQTGPRARGSPDDPAGAPPQEPFLRLIQKTVNEQVPAESARSGGTTLVTREVAGWTCQELRDQRLPAWCVLAWGQIDECFVLTLGEGVWPAVAAVAGGQARALSQDSWYRAAREPRSREALIEILVAAHEIQQRLDPFVHGRASAFFQAWEAGRLEQACWALGYEDRALFCAARFRVGDQTVERVYADPRERRPDLIRTVPPEAHYAVFRLPVERFLHRFFAGLLAVQSAEARANIERVWAEIRAEHDLDADRDLLAHLGEHIVLHNDPPHPLRLPLAVTALIEIRDDPARVRRTLETICSAWRARIDAAAARAERPPDFTLQRDDDGIWYLRFGPLAGLAWTVTDRFIVSSWSPHALREYLARAGDRAGRP